ncbi:hypothetical protein FRC03_010344 [Tulasnella sp. 419]|nr:hypothetical protein FRC03_010344 [Tulasnella sp. 419]
MVTDKKGARDLAQGTYLIRSMYSGTTLNFVVSDPQLDPYICIWRTTRSPTELWQLHPTENGYHIRNPSSKRYISYPEDLKEGNGIGVKAVNRPIEWLIEESIEGYYILRLASNPNLCIDLAGWEKRDGSWICIYGFHGDTNQRWLIEEVENQLPQIPTSRGWFGRIPSGVYWLGQPHEAGGLSQARKAPSIAALTVASLRTLEADQTTAAHLCATGLDYPWPNQIWVLEPGRHGYKLRNLGTESYLNYVNHEPVMDSAVLGDSGIAEWTVLRAYTENETMAWYIRPSSDDDVILGVTKDDMFNQMRVKPLSDYTKRSESDWNYIEWRLEPVDESKLKEFD